MKIFITGQKGFLAKNIIEYCLAKNIEVVGINNDLNLENKLHILDNGPYYDVDLFIHTAVGSSNLLLTNQIINLNAILLWVGNFFNSKFIAFGSSGSYKSKSTLEKDYLNSKTIDPYIISKRNLLTTLNCFNNWKYLILTSMFGENFKLNDTHLMHDMIKKIYSLKMGKKITKINLHKNSFRNFLYVKDAVRFIFENSSQSIVNLIGNRVKLSYCANIIAKEMYYNLNINDLFEQNVSKINGVKLKTVAKGFKFTPIENSLKNTVNYFLEEINKS